MPRQTAPEQTVDRDGPADDANAVWTPSPWVMRISALAINAVVVVAFGVAMMLCMVVWSDSEWQFPLALATVLVLGAAPTAIHEFGHLVAGRMAGMYVHRVQVGFIDALATRRGWRVRLKRPQFVHGMVIAFPDLSRPVAQQLVRIIAGGPAANLLVAVLAAAGAALAPPAAASVLAAFALTNAAIGIGNLLPLQKHMPSDGLQLLRLLKRRAFTPASLAFLRLNGLAMSGVTADRLPVADIETLTKGGPIERFCALWFRVKAEQGRGNFVAVGRLGEELQPCLDGMSDLERNACAPMAGLIRCELAFSAALDRAPVEGPLDADLDAEIDWIAPTVRFRCRALDAVAHGDVAAAEALLAQAETASERSADAAHRESEYRLRARIRQFAGHANGAEAQAEHVAVVE